MIRTERRRLAPAQHPNQRNSVAALEPRLEERPLGEAQRATARALVLEVSIKAEGVLDLCALRWLDPDKLRDAMAVTDAVVELTNAAISLRLQPGA